ncbi:MAG TPA: RNA-binding protein [Anaeromyxobacter sp.]|nr:RNA-binding protein [Anaeromyxobacter sp.]
MANKSLFRSLVGKLVPRTDAVNEAGGRAYARSPEGALAQYAATGCLNATFYAGADEQLGRVLELAAAVEPAFVAKTAVYARERAFMKDVPALLLASLSIRDGALFARAFPRVVTDARMLRTFVQILRSGAVGRKSLGTRPKRLVREWLAAQSGDGLLRASVGQAPSLADVVKMVHPKPASAEVRAFYGWLLGRAHDAAALPAAVKAFEAFKAGRTGEVPDVPFLLLTALPLGREEWAAVARRASWQTLRMNLATFARHGAFEVPGVAEAVAAKLRAPDAIRRARVFPYQLLVASTMADAVPRVVKDALQDAMELATANVPVLPGKVYVLPDTSGSMSSPVTGHRKGATSAVTCLDVAALVTAALLRKNPDAEVLPFAEDVKHARLEPRDTVTTNARALAALGGGGTNCSAPLAALNRRRAKGDVVVYVSDNQSWIDVRQAPGSATMQEWARFRDRNPGAKLVCIDLQPYGTGQAPDAGDVLNVGGFSDQVFEVVARFGRDGGAADHWARAVEEVQL